MLALGYSVCAGWWLWEQGLICRYPWQCFIPLGDFSGSFFFGVTSSSYTPVGGMLASTSPHSEVLAGHRNSQI